MEESGTKPHIPFGLKHFALFSPKPSVCERVLVSLEHWKQLDELQEEIKAVVICSHFSIFGTLETTQLTNFA